jgi:hypothetical protein
MSQISSTPMNCKTPVRRRLLPYEESDDCGQNPAPVSHIVEELLRAPRRQNPRRLFLLDEMDGLVRRLFSEDEPQNSDRNSGAVTPENRKIRVDLDEIVRAPRREPNRQPIDHQDLTPINLMKHFAHC